MSDTPRTDAIDAANESLSLIDAYAMMRGHARSLERELEEYRNDCVYEASPNSDLCLHCARTMAEHDEDAVPPCRYCGEEHPTNPACALKDDSEDKPYGHS